MGLKVYLAGEIHTNWREDIARGCKGLDVEFTAPVTDHDSSDDCGVAIMGPEKDKFWHDNKGAKLNAIRTRKAIEDADIVVVRFGEKYKQWNAAFDAGQAYAMGKSLIIMHQDEHQHPLKEIDAAALAVVKSPLQVSQILKYTLDGSLPKYGVIFLKFPHFGEIFQMLLSSFVLFDQSFPSRGMRLALRELVACTTSHALFFLEQLAQTSIKYVGVLILLLMTCQKVLQRLLQPCHPLTT